MKEPVDAERYAAPVAIAGPAGLLREGDLLRMGRGDRGPASRRGGTDTEGPIGSRD